jgi:hypothetical protein
VRYEAAGEQTRRPARQGRRLTFRFVAVGIGLCSLVVEPAFAAGSRTAATFAEITFVALGLGAASLVAELYRGRDTTRGWMPLRRSPSAWRWTTLAVGIVALLVVQRWFEPGRAIAGGNLAPPVGTEWLKSLFDPFAVAGSNLGGPAITELQAPWAAVLWMVHAIGGSGILAERLWMSGLFAGAALSALSLMRVVGCGPAAASVGATIYVCNPYALSAGGSDPVELAALALMPALAAVVIAVARQVVGVVPGALLFLLSAPLLGYLCQDPPLLVLVVTTIVAATTIAMCLGGVPALRRVAGLLLTGGVSVLLGGAYWIVPVALRLRSGAAIFAGPASWSAVDRLGRGASPFWLGTGSGRVGDSYDLVASGYAHLPISLVRYALPLAAFAVLLSHGRGRGAGAERGRRQLVGVVALLTLSALALDTALGDTAFASVRSVERLPAGSLLLLPGMFLAGAALGYSMLVALGLDALAQDARDRLPGRTLARRALPRRAVAVVAAGVGALVAVVVAVPSYAPPAGATVAVTTSPHASALSDDVAVPSYWSLMATRVDAAAGVGSVLLLPSDDYYQMPYDWGYYGSDDFIQQLMSRPVLDPSAEGPMPASAQLLSSVRLVSESLVAGQWREAAALLAALHSPFVLLRGDIDASFPGRDITSPVRLAAALRRDPSMRLVAREGPLELFVARHAVVRSVAVANLVATTSSTPDLALLGLLPAGSALVTERPRAGVAFAQAVPPLDRWTVAGSRLVTTTPRLPAERSVRLAVLGPGRSRLVALASSARVVPGLRVTAADGGYSLSVPLAASDGKTDPVYSPALELVGTPAPWQASTTRLWTSGFAADSGWHSQTGAPVTVDGMLRGWLVASSVRSLTISYGQSGLTRLGELASLFGAALGLAALGLLSVAPVLAVPQGDGIHSRRRRKRRPALRGAP